MQGGLFHRLTCAKRPITVSLSSGIGWQSMFPTIDLLYPEPTYMDIVELNYYHENPQYRRMYLQTYVVDPTNTALKAARNRKVGSQNRCGMGWKQAHTNLFCGRHEIGFSHYGSICSIRL